MSYVVWYTRKFVLCMQTKVALDDRSVQLCLAGISIEDTIPLDGYDALTVLACVLCCCVCDWRGDLAAMAFSAFFRAVILQGKKLVRVNFLE